MELRKCPRAVLTGDFNTQDTEELSLFEGYVTVNPRRFGSFYSNGAAIDHIFVPEGTRAENTRMLILPYSDHYPIVSDVYL